jgi:hypothetical protein
MNGGHHGSVFIAPWVRVLLSFAFRASGRNTRVDETIISCTLAQAIRER